MARVPRLLLLVLLVAGAVAAIALAIWMGLNRYPDGPPESYLARGPLGRALTRLASAGKGTQIIAGLAVAGVASLAAAFFVWKDRWWAHAAVAVGALATIPAIWWVHGKFAELEPAGYRARSPYVRAMTRVADGGTLYFVALALVAATAAAIVILAKRRAAKAALEKVMVTS